MLTQIDIMHLATIEKLHLDLYAGATVITGETGAGKSIIIDAIELALGGRTSGDVVRTGQDKAEVSISFNITQLPNVQQWLAEHDLDHEEDCILRRIISKDGKSRCYINSRQSTLLLLRNLSDLLVNVHGQHEHQALFKPENQRDMLDRYAGHQAILQQVQRLAEQRAELSKQIATLSQQKFQHSAKSDFLRFQLSELQELHLSAQEFQQLDAEHKLLANAGELLQNVHQSLQTLADDENHNAMAQLNQTLATLEDVESFEPKITAWLETLKTSLIQLSDIESDLRHYLDNVDLDPERLRWLEQRLSALFDMGRKHKVEPQHLYQLQLTIEAELNNLEHSDERLTELAEQLATTEKDYLIAAQKLTASRIKSAKKLTGEITQTIHELFLPHGKFNIKLSTDALAPFSPYGQEKILFEIRTNIGQNLQALAKVASGGELSRVSLAIHVATAEQHTIPTLIFDEVDAGISGGTAEVVGKLLRRLGQTHQLLCITHLPQVAAQGHQHLLVEKHHIKTGTITNIKMIDGKDKTHELARLLGGVKITAKTLAHAQEMLEKV